MLNSEDMALLDGETQQIYMAYVRRFESDDWKELVKWAEEQAGACATRQLLASKWDDVLISRGEMRAFNQISNLEASTENQFTALVEEARAKLIVKGEEEYE